MSQLLSNVSAVFQCLNYWPTFQLSSSISTTVQRFSCLPVSQLLANVSAVFHCLNYCPRFQLSSSVSTTVQHFSCLPVSQLLPNVSTVFHCLTASQCLNCCPKFLPVSHGISASQLLPTFRFPSSVWLPLSVSAVSQCLSCLSAFRRLG